MPIGTKGALIFRSRPQPPLATGSCRASDPAVLTSQAIEIDLEHAANCCAELKIIAAATSVTQEARADSVRCASARGAPGAARAPVPLPAGPTPCVQAWLRERPSRPISAISAAPVAAAIRIALNGSALT